MKAVGDICIPSKNIFIFRLWNKTEQLLSFHSEPKVNTPQPEFNRDSFNSQLIKLNWSKSITLLDFSIAHMRGFRSHTVLQSVSRIPPESVSAGPPGCFICRSAQGSICSRLESLSTSKDSRLPAEFREPGVLRLWGKFFRCFKLQRWKNKQNAHRHIRSETQNTWSCLCKISNIKAWKITCTKCWNCINFYWMNSSKFAHAEKLIKTGLKL